MIIKSLVSLGERDVEYYKGLVVRAHPNLHEEVAAKIKEILPDKGRILDLGCGQGAMTLRLKDMGYDVLAVDVNVEDFKADGVRFIPLNFDDPKALTRFVGDYESAFDLVLGLEVIEHVENQWEYVRLLRSMVKKGGYILLSTPNITSWLSRLIFLFFGKFHQFDAADLEYGHISPISAWHLRVVIEREGLEIVKIEPVGSSPFFFMDRFSKANLVYNTLNLLFYPFMKGIKRGWGILATIRNP